MAWGIHGRPLRRNGKWIPRRSRGCLPWPLCDHTAQARMIRVQDLCMPYARKQNVTVSLNPEMVKKAKILAAKRSTSISGLLAEQVEGLVEEDEAYEKAQASATARIDQGFHLGGTRKVSRDDLHER